MILEKTVYERTCDFFNKFISENQQYATKVNFPNRNYNNVDLWFLTPKIKLFISKFNHGTDIYTFRADFREYHSPYENNNDLNSFHNQKLHKANSYFQLSYGICRTVKQEGYFGDDDLPVYKEPVFPELETKNEYTETGKLATFLTAQKLMNQYVDIYLK